MLTRRHSAGTLALALAVCVLGCASGPRYDVVLPKGFARDDQHEPGQTPPDFVARYFRGEPPSQAAEVIITASEADDLGKSEAPVEQWTARVLARASESGEPASEHVRSLRAWQTPDGRAFEFALFYRGGCDPFDRYVRYAERGKYLYRIEITVPAGAGQREIEPLLETFFDRTTGPPAKPRIFAAAPNVSDGPC